MNELINKINKNKYLIFIKYFNNKDPNFYC